jgi:hypothetical protein
MNDRQDPHLGNVLAQRYGLPAMVVAGTAAAAAVMLATRAVCARTSPIPGPIDPAMGPLAVISYSLGEAGSWLLDRETGAYVPLPDYHRVTPSPVDFRAVVYDGLPAPRFGILDSPREDPRWILDANGAAVTGSAAGWSRDGREILITRPGAGFAIVQADTGAVRLVAHTGVVVEPGHRYVWAPDGDEIALTQYDEASAASGIQFYDRSGRTTRWIDASATLTTEAGFSPDRTWLALQADPPAGGPIRVVRATDGAPRSSLGGERTQFIGWAADDLLIVRENDKPGLRIVTLTGALNEEVGLPSVLAEEVHVGSTDGLNRDAYRISFGEW